MILYEYQCPRHGAFEQLETMGTTRASCPRCGMEAERVLTAPRLSYRLMGVDPAMTTAADRWADMHEAQAARESEWDPDDNLCRNQEH